MKIKFTKMHGTGNDYIYVNTFQYPIENPEALSVQWSKFHTGIGSDGLILIGPSECADFKMRIFNADGSEALMCGNGSRCVGKYVFDNGLTNKTDVSLETLSGIKILHLHVVDGKVGTVTVDMGEPSDIHSTQLGPDYAFPEGTAVSMGNPHNVVFVDNIQDVKLEEIGSSYENHPHFPNRVNTEFAQIRPDGTIRMRVWERGSGITMACGTGACATAVAAAYTGRRPRQSDIEMDGGTLHIEWSEQDGHVYMTGPATKVFDGEIELL